MENKKQMVKCLTCGTYFKSGTVGCPERLGYFLGRCPSCDAVRRLKPVERERLRPEFELPSLRATVLSGRKVLGPVGVCVGCLFWVLGFVRPSLLFIICGDVLVLVGLLPVILK